MGGASQESTAQAPCPVEGCDGVIKVRRDLPNGEYDCLCRARRLRLSWISTWGGGREPMLYEVPRP